MARKSASTQISYEPSQRIMVLHGAERFLIEEYTRRYIHELDARFGGVEQFHFDGETAQAAAVLDELRSYGLMQKHKVVVLDNADVFLKGGKGEDDEEDEKKGPSVQRKLMEKYAEKPVEDATLIMRASTWRPSNIDKLVAKVGGVYACDEVNDARAAQWCIQRASKEWKCTVEPDAAALLVQRLGPKLLHLDTELSKLASMAGVGKPITRSLVAEAVEMSREEKAWQIQDAIASRDAAVIIRKLTELLQVSRHDVVPLSWSIIDLMRKLHLAAQMLRQGVPAGSVMGKARMWGDSGSALLGIARSKQPAELAQLLHAAIETDRGTKTGLGDPVRSLEALLVTIADRVKS